MVSEKVCCKCDRSIPRPLLGAEEAERCWEHADYPAGGEPNHEDLGVLADELVEMCHDGDQDRALGAFATYTEVLGPFRAAIIAIRMPASLSGDDVNAFVGALYQRARNADETAEAEG